MSEPDSTLSERVGTYYAELRRDAERFRKLEAQYYAGSSGRPGVGAIRLERYDAAWNDWVELTSGTLADIADALPEVNVGFNRP